MKVMREIMTLIVVLCMFITSQAAVIDDFTGSPAIDAESSAVLVLDLADGTVLASHNASRPLIPASIMKSVTIATLLHETGIDYRYVTKIYTDGKMNDGTLSGNLIIVGSGDPSLNSSKEPGSADICREILESLKDKGIKRIEGDVIIDESLWSGPACPPSWASGDLPHSYGTGAHAFNFEDNSSGKRSVQNPAEIFRSRLKSLLASNGITVEGNQMERGHRRHLRDHKSATIDEIMRSCMMRSDNMFAESLLRTYAVEKGRKGNTAEAAELESNYWKHNKVPMAGVEIVDGSGLSRSNRVTADFMAGVLGKMAENVDYASFFPLAGQEGTLRNFLKDSPLDGYVALKTGSMSGIQCYAGYKLDDNYAPTHVVVVILNKLPKGRASARQAVSRLMFDIFCEGSQGVSTVTDDGVEGE